MTTLRGVIQAVLVVVVFWTPGLAVLRSLGFAGWLRTFAVSPAVTLAVCFAGSVTAARLHVPWNLPVAVGWSGGLGLLGYLLRGRRKTVRRAVSGAPLRQAVRRNWTLLTVVVLAVVAQLLPVWRPILRREQIANLPDTLFHLNALQYVRLQHVADPSVFGRLIDPAGGTSFYPSAWHAVAGIVPVTLDNASALAAASFVVVAGAWSLGLAALARELAVTTGSTAAVLAAALSGCGYFSPLEPALLIGIVPNAVGMALVPGVAALLINAVRPGGRLRGLGAHLPTLLALLGLGACHPSALAGVVVLVSPWFVTAGFRWWRSATPASRRIAEGFVLAAVGAAVYVVVTDASLAGVRSRRSEGTYGLGDALVGLASGFTWENSTFSVVVPVFALFAWVQRIRYREALLPLVSWLVLAGLYVLAAMDVRWAGPATGFFYGESRRIGPILAVLVVISAAEGLTRASRWLVGRTQLPPEIPAGIVVGFVSGTMVVLSSWQPVLGLLRETRDAYTTVLERPVVAREIIPFFTPEELKMADRLPSELPRGSVVFGSGKSGASHLYGIEGIDALPFARGITDDLAYAGSNIDRIDDDPRVCAALRAHRVTHLYVDPYLWKAAGWPLVPGPFQALPAKDFQLVDEGGDAKVYQIVACRA